MLGGFDPHQYFPRVHLFMDPQITDPREPIWCEIENQKGRKTLNQGKEVWKNFKIKHLPIELKWSDWVPTRDIKCRDIREKEPGVYVPAWLTPPRKKVKIELR